MLQRDPYEDTGGKIMAGLNLGFAKQRPERVDVRSAEQKGLWEQLYKMLSSGAQGGVTSYPGQMYVPTTGQEALYLDSINRNQATREGAIEQIASGRLSEDQKALFTDKTALNNFYENSIRNPAIRELNETILPSVDTSFVGPGFHGSARANARAKAATDVATSIAAKRAELEYAREKEHMGALEGALNRQTGAPAAYTNEANIMGQAGALTRQVEQEKMLSDLQRWYSGETINGVSASQYNPYLQLIFQALGLNPIAVGQKGSEFKVGANVSYKE